MTCKYQDFTLEIPLHYYGNLTDMIHWLAELFSGSRIKKEDGYSEEEMSYVKQGEDALQKAIKILSEQDGWTIETVAVSTETALP